MICTFFGHRDTPKEIEPILRLTLIDLIENKNIKTFYIGNNGNFDKMAFSVLSELSKTYSVKIFIILSYMPKKENYMPETTMLPSGIEAVPPQFAIPYRNKWMIEHSDYVITSVTHTWGGAAKFKNMAQKMGKNVINIK